MSFPSASPLKTASVPLTGSPPKDDGEECKPHTITMLGNKWSNAAATASKQICHFPVLMHWLEVSLLTEERKSFRKFAPAPSETYIHSLQMPPLPKLIFSSNHSNHNHITRVISMWFKWWTGALNQTCHHSNKGTTSATLHLPWSHQLFNMPILHGINEHVR